MKKLISIFLISIIASCNGNDKPKTSVHNTVSKTTKVLACYVDMNSGKITSGVVFMITHDTMVYKSADSLTLKKQWVSDTAFATPQLVHEWNGIKKDTTVIPYVPRLSVSVELNVDSAVAILQRWVDTNRNYFSKPDTTKQK